MASCDDDFSLLGDDNPNNKTPSNPNPNLLHHHHQQNQHFAQRFTTRSTPINAPPPILAPVVSPKNISGVDEEDEVDAEGYTNGVFCSQPDPKCSTTSFHGVNANPLSADNNDSNNNNNKNNQFENDSDPNKGRVRPGNLFLLFLS